MRKPTVSCEADVPVPVAERLANADLTRRQLQIAELAATTSLGLKQLAAEFGIAVGTMKNHLQAVYDKLGVDGRIGLVLWYWRRKAQWLQRAASGDG